MSAQVFNGSASSESLKGDGTLNRKLKAIILKIVDGTSADTIKCQTSDRFNGDVIGATDNIGKTGSPVGNFQLDVSGSSLTILAAGFTGNVVGVLSCSVVINNSALAIAPWCNAYAGGNNLNLSFGVDITPIAGGVEIDIAISYITAA